jgi:hypothetical protein
VNEYDARVGECKYCNKDDGLREGICYECYLIFQAEDEELL